MNLRLRPQIVDQWTSIDLNLSLSLSIGCYRFVDFNPSNTILIRRLRSIDNAISIRFLGYISIDYISSISTLPLHLFGFGASFTLFWSSYPLTFQLSIFSFDWHHSSITIRTLPFFIKINVDSTFRQGLGRGYKGVGR